MKKSFLTTILLITVSVTILLISSGCTPNDKDLSSSESAAVYPITVENTDDIKELMAPEIFEIEAAKYKEAMVKLEREFSYYNLSMASIHRNVVSMFYFMFKGSGEPDWINETPKALEYLTNRSEFPPIYSGISNDCIKIIVILQPIFPDHEHYVEAINTIYGDDSEYFFLSGLRTLEGSTGYYAVDVYVEDLLDIDRKINFNKIVLMDDWIDYNDAEKHNLTQQPNDDVLEQHLTQFGREVNYSNLLKNKEWNLFLFKLTDRQPYNVSIDLITYDRNGVDAIK